MDHTVENKNGKDGNEQPAEVHPRSIARQCIFFSSFTVYTDTLLFIGHRIEIRLQEEQSLAVLLLDKAQQRNIIYII